MSSEDEQHHNVPKSKDGDTYALPFQEDGDSGVVSKSPPVKPSESVHYPGFTVYRTVSIAQAPEVDADADKENATAVGSLLPAFDIDDSRTRRQQHGRILAEIKIAPAVDSDSDSDSEYEADDEVASEVEDTENKPAIVAPAPAPATEFPRLPAAVDWEPCTMPSGYPDIPLPPAPRPAADDDFKSCWEYPEEAARAALRVHPDSVHPDQDDENSDKENTRTESYWQFPAPAKLLPAFALDTEEGPKRKRRRIRGPADADPSTRRRSTRLRDKQAQV